MSDDYLICSECRKYHHLSRWGTGMSETQHLVVEGFLIEHFGLRHHIQALSFERMDSGLYFENYERQDWWSAAYRLAKERKNWGHIPPTETEVKK